MASMTRRRVVVNPGRKRRKNLSLKQLLHFGTKRQRAGAAVRLKRKRSNGILSWRKSKKAAKKAGKTTVTTRFGRPSATGSGFSYKKKGIRSANGRRRRRRNVGTILSVIPNGRKSRKRRKNRTTVKVYNKRRTKRRVNKGMARHYKRRRKASAAPVRRRRRRTTNPRRRRTYNRRRRRNVSYVGRIKRGMYKYSNPRRRRRTRNSGRRRSYHRRRNPGMLSGGMGKIVGIIGGAAVTAVLSKFIPSGLSTGFMGYVTKGIVAVLQGRLVGKLSGSRALGQDFMYGGLAYVALSVMNDMFGLRLPGFGMSGMGLIAPSSFYVPQVNAPGSMGSFIRPSMVPAPYVAPAGGMGNVRRGGRVR